MSVLSRMNVPNVLSTDRVEELVDRFLNPGRWPDQPQHQTDWHAGYGLRVVLQMAAKIGFDLGSPPGDEERIFMIACGLRGNRGVVGSGDAVILTKQALNDLAQIIQSSAVEVPVDMVLHCPACRVQHIDSPEERCSLECEKHGRCYAEEHGRLDQCTKWKNPPHRTHRCNACGHLWRPSDRATNGVLQTSSGKHPDNRPRGDRE